MVLMVRGCEVAVKTNGDTVHVICSDLPQLSVSDSTLAGALSRAEDAIDAILAGRLVLTEEGAPGSR